MFKKILLITFVVLFLAVAIFLLLGFLNPSFSYETRVTIDRSREDVWRLFNDETKMGDWLVGFKSIETISGERNTVGSKYRVHFSQDGREFEMIEEMKEFHPPDTFAFRLDSDFFADDVRVTFNDLGGKTEVVLAERATGNNILRKSLLYWMRSHFTTGARNNLDNLKKYVEAAK